MIAICPAGPPKEIKPSFAQYRHAWLRDTSLFIGAPSFQISLSAIQTFSSFERSVSFVLPYHLFAVSVKRIVHDPLGCVDLVIVFEADVSKSLSDSAQAG